MDPDYLPFHPSPRKPDFRPPPGAVDSHCHVFGPADRFPYAPESKYTPCDAPREKLFELRDHLGFSRNVIVQASCHGSDNSALVDALCAAGDNARGVAVVRPNVTDSELDELHAAGVRGVRFNFVRRLVNTAPREIYRSIADRIAQRGWHSVVYFEAADLEDLTPFLSQLEGPVVIDHMGRPDIGKGADHEDFRKLVSLLDRQHNIWTKVSCPERLSDKGPPCYSDVVPFAGTLVARFPDRVLWGTDWPHPNMKSHMPDDGDLVDVIPRIAVTKAHQRALLVDNPMRLYWS